MREVFVPVVMLKGMLYAGNSESECEVLAWRSGESSERYSQLRVIDAPLNLPDGTYSLVVNSTVYSTEKLQGWWQMVHAVSASA
jgi:hypothetical protein